MYAGNAKLNTRRNMHMVFVRLYNVHDFDADDPRHGYYTEN
jgi:hypothetical protein